MNNGQAENIKRSIVAVLKKHKVRKAALFGSMTTGKATTASDIDLLVEFSGKKSLLDLSGLKIELQEILKKEVDVLTYNSIHPLLRKKILAEQVAVL